MRQAPGLDRRHSVRTCAGERFRQALSGISISVADLPSITRTDEKFEQQLQRSCCGENITLVKHLAQDGGQSTVLNLIRADRVSLLQQLRMNLIGRAVDLRKCVPGFDDMFPVGSFYVSHAFEGGVGYRIWWPPISRSCRTGMTGDA